jgi:hypothetical protein
MRFLVNENVTRTVIEVLRQRGHDVYSVKESMHSANRGGSISRRTRSLIVFWCACLLSHGAPLHGDDVDDVVKGLTHSGVNVNAVSFAGVRSFVVHCPVNACTDDNLREIARLRRVRTLRLADCSQLTEAGVGSLATLEHLGEIRAGEVAFSLSAFQSLKTVAGLRLLRLSGPSVTDDSLQALAQLPELQDVGLLSADLSDGAVIPLSTIRTLKALRLPDVSISDAGLASLALLPELTTLSFRANAMTPAGMSQFGQFDHLEDLTLAGWPPGDLVLGELSACTSLRRMTLSRTGTESLAGLDTILSLEELGISSRALEPVDMEAVARCQQVRRLRLLTAATSRDAMGHLSRMHSLEELVVDYLGSGVSIAELQDIRPDVVVLQELAAQ